MTSELSTPRWESNSFRYSTPRREDSFRSFTNTLNRSDLSIYSTKSRVSTYDNLRERALARRVLYEDPVFPASDSSLQINYRSFTDDIEWKRPHDISRRPSFITQNPGTFDVTPGIIGNSWLLPALSCLTLAPTLVQKCIPEGQAFDEHYGGIFRFRFWRYGEWIEVVIDDRLPTHRGKLLFTRNTDPNEFWLALFEKAYAKLYGSYGAIQGTMVIWALQDITGGITDNFIFKDNAVLMQKMVDLSMERTSLISATILTQGPPHRQLPNGLVTGRAYSITGYAEIPLDDKSAILVRLRYPWGKALWNGAWSERSTLWTTVSYEIKMKLSYGKLKESEFWMSFSEFSRMFSNLEICHLSPEAWKLEPKLKHRIPWKSVEAHRQWRRGFNAGGGLDSHLLSCNSQFYIELRQKCCVVLSLMQKYRLLGENREFVPCGCLIFKAPQGRTTRLQTNNFVHSMHTASTGIRTDRDIVRFFTLLPGSYVILPVTEKHGMEGKFYLRMFTDDRSAVVRELDDPDTVTILQEQDDIDTIEVVEKQLDADMIFFLRKRFLMFCNRYEEIDGYGLKAILSYKEQNKTTPMLCCDVEQEEVHIQRIFLSPETCKAAITIFDKDMNGRLTYDEYMQLLQKLSFWQNIFRRFAVGNGSVMDSYSLRNAFRIAGFSISNKIMEALVLRFAAKDFINLEGFINSVVKLHVAHQRQTKPDGSTQTNEKENKKYLQELLRTAIYS